MTILLQFTAVGIYKINVTRTEHYYKQNASSLSQRMVSDLQAGMGNITTELQTVLNHSSIDSMGTAEAAVFAKKILNSSGNKYMEGILVSKPDGTAVTQDGKTIDISSRDYFRITSYNVCYTKLLRNSM